jgi:hypothetical protein
MASERRQILEAIANVRNGVSPHRHLPFGQHQHRIPMQDYQALCMLYPLNAVDPHEKAAAWEAFDKGPFAEPYRVGKVVRGVTKNGIIIP